MEGSLRLRIETGRLAITNSEDVKTFVLPRDIAVLILDHPAVTLTAACLKSLADAGTIVLVTDLRHMPLALCLPLPAPSRSGIRLRQQLAFEESHFSARAWQQIIITRIRTQAKVLRSRGRLGALNLERMASRVEEGDATNAEAQAAKHYWKHLFPEGFRRIKQAAEDNVNARLNYGYAIVRSLIARATVSAGLNTNLGIGHCSMENPFNLADDFLEAYRFVVEQHVAKLLEDEPEAQFDPAGRKRIAECVSHEVELDGDTYRLASAIDATVASFTRALERPGSPLVLPGGLA